MNIKYLLKKVKETSLKRFTDVSKEVSKVNNRSSFINLLDIFWCFLLYGSGPTDYKEFEMYKLDFKGRKNVLTIGKNNKIVKKYCDKRYIKFFDDKIVFNKKFNKYIGRDWICIGDNITFGKYVNSEVKESDYVKSSNLEDFKSFINNHDSFMAKAIDLRCGKGIDKYYSKDITDVNNLYHTLIKNGQYLIEEVANQCDEMNKLCPTSVNTIRLVTLLKNGNEPVIVSGCVRMGRVGSCVDNFNHGGVCSILDINTGKLVGDCYDKNRNVYKVHPDTKTEIDGFEIPMFNEAVNLCKEASLVIPQIGYAGWDVCITDKGPILIEGNYYPGSDATQNIKYDCGTIGAFRRALGRNEI